MAYLGGHVDVPVSRQHDGGARRDNGFVPAGVAHTYYEAAGPTRYLLIMTPRLRELVAALHTTPRQDHRAILRQFASDMGE